MRLMASVGMEEALRSFHGEGGVLFGTCAGLILLAAKVTGPDQPSLALLDAEVERNGYGRQIDSFIGTGRIGLPGEENGTSRWFSSVRRASSRWVRACA